MKAERRLAMDFASLIEMSRKYGSDPEFVLAGGGNTSRKEGGAMAVKASGAALSDIDEDGFVLMDVGRLRALTQNIYPGGDDEREACAARDMMAARLDGQGEKRPSVECILHALFPQKYVLHVHPPLINGLTCGRDGAEAAAGLFSDVLDGFLWFPLIKPGLVLSKACADAFAGHNGRYGKYPSVVLLQNHGIFVAADDTEGIDRLMADAVRRVSSRVARRPDFTPVDGLYGTCQGDGSFGPPCQGDGSFGAELETLYGGVAKCLVNNEIARLVSSREAYAPLLRPFSPDHIVYCRAYPLFIEDADTMADGFAAYEARHGYKPKIVAVSGVGAFALGKDENEAGKAAELFTDAVKVAVYSESFGGPLHLPDDFTEFIVNWEIESYRQKQAFG